MQIFTKFLTVPETNATRQIEVAQLWEVRWRSRFGKYNGDTRPEVEAFASEEEAKAFATALRQAFTLLRHTSGTDVTVTKGKAI